MVFTFLAVYLLGNKSRPGFAESGLDQNIGVDGYHAEPITS